MKTMNPLRLKLRLRAFCFHVFLARLTLLLSRRNSLHLVLGIMVFSVPPARAAVTEAWVHRYSSMSINSDDTAITVARDAAGDILVTGITDNYITGMDILTIKYSGSDGTVLWQKRYNGPLNGEDIAAALAVDSHGNVVVTGCSEDAIYTAKYASANGALLWEKRSTGGNNEAVALALDSSGNVVVTGWSSGAIYTAKYAALNGALIWEQRHSPSAKGHAFPRAMAVDASGNAVVTGVSWNGNDYDYYTAKYAAADGELLWEQRYCGDPANGNDVPTAVEVDGVGNVVVTGESHNGSNSDYYTAKYAAADGALLWEQRYNGPLNGDDIATALAMDSHGNVVVTGSSERAIYTAKYASANGALLWEKRYHRPANHYDGARAVGVDASGNVVVTGESHNGNNLDYYTAKYAAADGALLWEQRYNGPANSSDSALAVAADANGNVVVTGVSWNGTDYDYYTAKYAAADGALLWEQRHRGDPANGNDVLIAVAVDGVGNVVVTGYSERTDYGGEQYTAKYAASDGALLWERRNSNAVPYDVVMAMDGSGNVVVAGHYDIAKYAAADGALIWEKAFTNDFNVSAVAVDTNDDVVVSRWFEGFGIHNFITKHAATDGALLWEQLYLGRRVQALAVDRGGNVVVAGQAGNSSAYTSKLAAADGVQLWERQYAGSGTNGAEIRAVAVDMSGNIAVAGVSLIRNSFATDHYTAKYAALDGTPLWESCDNGPDDRDDAANAVAVDLDGNVIVTGYSVNTNWHADFYTAKYAAADGTLLWEKRYNGEVVPDLQTPWNRTYWYDEGLAVAVDGSGNVIVTGYSHNTNFSTDFYTAKYAAADGVLAWGKRYNGPANGDEIVYAGQTPLNNVYPRNRRTLALGPNGMIVITGSSDGNFGPGTTYDFATVVYREVLPAVTIERFPTGVRIRFTGESGRSYRIERAPAVTGPWTTLATPTAPIGGIIEYLDVNPPPGQAFYRTVQP
jgi:uncharacterized delta-60 repeat protein